MIFGKRFLLGRFASSDDHPVFIGSFTSINNAEKEIDILVEEIYEDRDSDDPEDFFIVDLEKTKLI